MHHFNRQTTEKHNFLTRIDPRVKLLCALALLVMVISGNGFVFPLVVAALGLSLCLFIGIRPKAIALRFVEPGFIIAMIVLLKLFFTGHAPLFSLSVFGLEITGHREGLLEGLRIACRITGAVAVVTTLGFATPFTELMAAFAWLRVPRGFIEISLFAWRYLFLLFDDARVIYDAQKNRLGYTGYRQGLRSFGTLTGSLVIKAFDNSSNVTTAMVQRGYDGNMPTLRHKPFKRTELAYSVLFVAAMVIVREVV
jgi:cobalt/nickel transport system permease protein